MSKFSKWIIVTIQLILFSLTMFYCTKNILSMYENRDKLILDLAKLNCSEILEDKNEKIKVTIISAYEHIVKVEYMDKIYTLDDIKSYSMCRGKENSEIECQLHTICYKDGTISEKVEF